MLGSIHPSRILEYFASKQNRRLRIFLRNGPAMLGLGMAVIVTLVAVLSPLLAPYDPLTQDIDNMISPPNTDHLLGTDRFGRDLLSRLIWGTRVSLSVGAGAILIGMTLGTIVGILAGVSTRRVGDRIMRGVDVLLSFPDEILGIMFMVILGPGLINITVGIGLLMVSRFARLVYGSTLSIVQRQYVEACKALGGSRVRVMIRHVLPNLYSEIFVIGSLWTATAIRVEANLSFLGFGVAPPIPTWGNMIRDGVIHLVDAPWLSLSPGLAIAFTVLAFNLFADGLRDIADPRTLGRI